MKHIFSFFLMMASCIAGQLTITAENDFPWHDDADYTHGTRIEYIDNGLRFGVQQQMYTPLDLRNVEQVEGRHPYAGTLLGFVGYRDPYVLSTCLTAYDDYELLLGVLGPASRAEDVQREIHKLVGAKNPQGWDHQLHDEPVFQTVYWKGLDWRIVGNEFGWSLHWESELGGLLGTLQTALGVNTAFKLGYGFGSGETDSEIRVRGLEKPVTRIYVLAGVEGRWWLRNELLEGNAGYVHNHDTLTVEKEDLTGCLKAGFGIGYGRLDARILWMWWSREYKTQESTPNYASLMVGWGF